MIQLDYTEWEKVLTEHKEAMQKELAEVRQYKQELAELKSELMELGFAGKYERDSNTLILSAPHIVIGNVDKCGNLLDGPGSVVIRSHDVSIEGVGTCSGGDVSGGTVTTRARYINNVTVDPGIDGAENVAFSDSRFSVTSASVGMVAETIDDSESGGVFTMSSQASEGSISMQAEISVNAIAACDIAHEDKMLENTAKQCEADAKMYEASVDATIKAVAKNTDALDSNISNPLLDLLGAADEDADIMTLRTGLYEYDRRSQISETETSLLASNLKSCADNLSALAEATRVATYLKARNERLESEKGEYETEPTGSGINLVAENITMSTAGADGKIRTSDGNGVKVQSQNVTFEGMDAQTPIQDSAFKVVANKIHLDASDYTYEEKDGASVLSKSEAKGTILLNAKDVELCGNDATYEADGDSMKVNPTLAKGSLLYANFSNTHFDMADEEGKAQGIFVANAKDVYISSYDIDKDNRITPQGVADGGKIGLGAKDLYLGDVVSGMKSESIQLSSTHVSLLGDDKVDLQQAKDNSHLQLSDIAELAGKDVKIIGNITMGGKTEFKDQITACDIEAKNVKASSSVMGPNLKDGMPIPAPAAPMQPTKGVELKDVEALDKIRDTADQEE